MSATHLRLRASIAPAAVYGAGPPVQAETLTPDQLAGLSRAQVEALPLRWGRRWVTVGDLFEVHGDGAEEIVVEGDLGQVKRVGWEMTRGRITLLGDAGAHLGARMRGGKIVVHGNVGAWAGAGMAGGTLWVHGDAGPLLGAAYPGEKQGMREGVIIVDGNAGRRAGERMRRGLILIQGNLGESAGAGMIAGSIFVLGRLGARPGAGMKRGTILTLGGPEEALPPTFGYACTYRPLFVRTYLLRLQAWGVGVRTEHLDGLYRRYSGDGSPLGKGEILVYDQRE